MTPAAQRCAVTYPPTGECCEREAGHGGQHEVATTGGGWFSWRMPGEPWTPAYVIGSAGAVTYDPAGCNVTGFDAEYIPVPPTPGAVGIRPAAAPPLREDAPGATIAPAPGSRPQPAPAAREGR